MSTRIFGLFTAAAVLIGCALGQTTTTTKTTEYSFPLIPLGSTETLGANLINNASNGANGAPASCTGSVTFENTAGTTIGTPTSFTLGANAVTSATLTFANSGLSALRGLIRIVLTTTYSTPAPPCALAYSVNTFDSSSGATHIFITGSNAATPLPIAVASPGR